MTRGRPPRPETALVTAPLKEEALASASQALTTMEQLDSAVSEAQVAFSQAIGARLARRQQAALFSKLVTVTDLIELQQIKESRAYRGMKFVQPDAKVVTVTTWADYCASVEGRSVEQVDEDLRNIKAFGAEFMEEAQRMGLGYRELRDMRALPADQRTELLEAAKAGDRDALIDAADAFLERNTKETAKLTARVEEAEGRTVALEKLVETKNSTIDELSTFTPSKRSIARTLEQHKQLEELRAQTNGAEVSFIALCNVVAAIEAGDSKPMRAHAQQAVQYLALRLAETIEELGIEVSLAEQLAVRPAWLDALDPERNLTPEA